MLRIFAFALLVLIVRRPAAVADVVPDLYFAQTIVTGTVEPERTRGFREALTEVVVKLTGNPRLAGSLRLAPMLESPAPLVERFEYEDRMKDLPVRDEQGTRERPHFLRVWFAPGPTTKALAKLGLRQWQTDRPRVSVRLAITTGGGAFWLAGDGDAGALQRLVLQDAARRRGLPLTLPSAEDVQRLGAPASASDSNGLRRIAGTRLVDGSARSSAQPVLVGTLGVRSDGYWRTRWWLRTRAAQPPSHLSHADADGVTFDTALKGAVDTAVLSLSGHGY